METEYKSGKTPLHWDCVLKIPVVEVFSGNFYDIQMEKATLLIWSFFFFSFLSFLRILYHSSLSCAAYLLLLYCHLSCSHQDLDAQSTDAARADRREWVCQWEEWHRQHCTLLIHYLLVIVCRYYRDNNFAISSNIAHREGMWHFSANQECLGTVTHCQTGLYRALTKQQIILAIKGILITKTCFCSSCQAAALFLNFLYFFAHHPLLGELWVNALIVYC